MKHPSNDAVDAAPYWRGDIYARNYGLAAMLYEYAAKPNPLAHLIPAAPPVAWWRRAWRLFYWRVDPWVPRVHLGPCDHEGCD